MKVGSLVELIDNNWRTTPLEGETFPITGVVYTVRDLVDFRIFGAGIGIRLEEIVNPPVIWDEECSFDIKKFREIQPPINIDIESIIEQPIECV